MSLYIATLLSFVILGCFASTKKLIAIVGLAALFYVSLPAFISLLIVMGAIFYFTN
jgi:hypothetical protein